MNHRLGNNSALDTDMDLIETFIKCHQQPDNELIQKAVFDYYKSQALIYWDKLEEFLVRE